MVTAAFLQKSTVLSNRRLTAPDGLNGKASNAIQQSLPLLASDLAFGTHTSSCGHVMHASCWKTYFEDIQNSERNRSRLRSPQNFNALKQEFLCPMCRSLSNAVIPLIPQLHSLQTLPSGATPEVSRNPEMLAWGMEQAVENDDATVSTGMTRLTLSRG